MSGFFGWGIRGAILGVLIGSLIVFVQFVQKKTKPVEISMDMAAVIDARSATDYTPYLARDREVVLRRIAVAQALADDTAAMDKTIELVNDSDDIKDSVRNEIVYNLIQAAGTTTIKKEKIELATQVAGKIKSPLIKGDALGRLARYQAAYDMADDAKGSSTEAFKIASTVKPPEPPENLEIYLALWPAGLAVFGFFIGGCLGSWFMTGASHAAPAKAMEEEEEEEEEEEVEEEDEEEEEEEKVEEVAAEAIESASILDAPVEDAIEIPAPAPAPAAPPKPGPALRPAAAGSLLQKPIAQPVPAGAAGKPTATAPPAKPTAMAPQGQPTKMAPTAVATKLAPRAIPTQLAPQEEANK